MRQVLIYPDKEDGGYVVEVPSLPGCVSEGETVAEALENIRDAIEAWIETAKEAGDPIPPEGCDVQLVVLT